MTMQVVLANPRGFCAGVDRAIEIVERALEKYGSPIYVRHEVVHNRFVVDSLRKKGAVFVDQLDEIPADSTVIFKQLYFQHSSVLDDPLAICRPCDVAINFSHARSFA